MTLNTNRDGSVAVDVNYHWQSMDCCPRGVKLQLKGKGGVAVYGTYDGKSDWWTGWAPLPTEAPRAS